MKAKEKCEWIKQNISIVDYASSIGFTVVRKGKLPPANCGKDWNDVLKGMEELR